MASTGRAGFTFFRYEDLETFIYRKSKDGMRQEYVTGNKSLGFGKVFIVFVAAALTNYFLPLSFSLCRSSPFRSILRHPSYFGFYYWALGSQLMMMNPVCIVAFTGVLQYFFSDRIQYEEGCLIRFFGQAYRDYQARTHTGIPFIK
jgi:uncharacterized membrane protein